MIFIYNIHNYNEDTKLTPFSNWSTLHEDNYIQVDSILSVIIDFIDEWFWLSEKKNRENESILLVVKAF